MLLNNSSETILLRAKDGLTCIFAFEIELYKREVKGFLILYTGCLLQSTLNQVR